LARSASTASVLQGKLTERGLVRVLGSHGVAPAIVQHYSPDEAARRLQRRLGPSIVRKAEKKTAHTRPGKKAKHAKKAKKAMKSIPKKSADHGPSPPRPNIWKRVRRELHVLICTKDPRYKSLRQSLGKESRMTQAAMVSAIGAAIYSYVGAAAAVIAPWVTLGLLAFLQIGTNAYCSA
jgi:hypothetical protein